MGYLLIKCEHCNRDFEHWVVHRVNASKKRFCERCSRARAKNGGKKIVRFEGQSSTAQEVSAADELKVRPCLGCGKEFSTLKSKRFCATCTFKKNLKKKRGKPAFLKSFYS